MRVLVADDDVALLEVLCRGLREYGCTVDAVDCGEAVVDAVRHAEYDAVVLDWRMPGMDGVEALAALRADGRWVPVLMLSACDSTTDRATALRAGANAYLGKPFRFDELVPTLRLLVEHGKATHAGGSVAGDGAPGAPHGRSVTGAERTLFAGHSWRASWRGMWHRWPAWVPRAAPRGSGR